MLTGALSNIGRINTTSGSLNVSPAINEIKVAPYIKNLTVSQNPYEISKGNLVLTYDTNYVQKTNSDKPFGQYITTYDPQGDGKKVSINVKSFGKHYNNEGTNQVVWDGKDNYGKTVAPGSYFFTVIVSDFSIPGATIPFTIK